MRYNHHKHWLQLFLAGNLVLKNNFQLQCDSTMLNLIQLGSKIRL